MTKAELEELIQGVAVTLVYGEYLSEFAEKSGAEADMVKQMKTKGWVFKAPRGATDESLHPNQLHAMFSQADTLPVVKRNLDALLTYSLLRLGYEAILLYCEENGHKALMHAESWWPYAKVMRNVVSHGDHAVLRKWPVEWRDTPKNRSKGTVRASVSWRHRTIAETDVTTHVIFTMYDAWKLHLDMLDFVKSSRLPQPCSPGTPARR